ncbi:MAG TPA: hypothetical protein VNA65_05530, partial [Candidatus Dormibacteraeota bacterium]|nr:hypothetical protein [Candidatus Dormibacteraeota bacterium]
GASAGRARAPMNDIYNNPIGHWVVVIIAMAVKARGGQVPPAEPSQQIQPWLAASNGCGCPAKPGNAEARQ